MIRALALLVVIPSALCGQFEVASVKISRTPNGPSAVHIYSIPGRIVIQNRTLREILAEAYKLREFQVKGPDWLADDRFDITALKPPNATPEQTRAMLQQLLTERFKLSARLITRVIPVHELLRAGSGSMLFPGKEDKYSFRLTWGRLTGENATMAQLADTLSEFLDRPVVDRTKLAGVWNLALNWTPDEVQRGYLVDAMGLTVPEQAHAGPSTPPSLFTAITEQLGLRLRSGKAPMPMLVVQAASRIPTAN